MGAWRPTRPEQKRRLYLPWNAEDYEVWRVGYDMRFYPFGDLPAFMEWPIPRLEDHPDVDTYAPWTLWQCERCAICGDVDERRSLHKDHDHDTGLIRGLLCGSCNTREGTSREAVFDHWRAGMNPCAMFGWDYLWQGQHNMKELTPEEVLVQTRGALAYRLALPGLMRDAMNKMGALLEMSGGTLDDKA